MIPDPLSPVDATVEHFVDGLKEGRALEQAAAPRVPGHLRAWNEPVILEVKLTPEQWREAMLAIPMFAASLDDPRPIGGGEHRWTGLPDAEPDLLGRE